MAKFNGGKGRLEGKAQTAPASGGEDLGQRLTHLDPEGRARMVDVSGKPDSDRTALATGTVTMRPETLALILQGRVEKGDVFVSQSRPLICLISACSKRR
jgi:hypothetical protein